jgi:hypothetical protein
MDAQLIMKPQVNSSISSMRQISICRAASWGLKSDLPRRAPSSTPADGCGGRDRCLPFAAAAAKMLDLLAVPADRRLLEDALASLRADRGLLPPEPYQDSSTPIRC